MYKSYRFIIIPVEDRAEDGAQTRDPQLGRLMLYQLSYFRIRDTSVVTSLGEVRRLYPVAVGSDGFEPP